MTRQITISGIKSNFISAFNPNDSVCTATGYNQEKTVADRYRYGALMRYANLLGFGEVHTKLCRLRQPSVNIQGYYCNYNTISNSVVETIV